MTIADVRVGLRAYLLDDAGIAAIVGTRVYPIILPQGTVQPSIVYTRVSGVGDNHMQGPSGLSRPRFQVDCWAQSADMAAQLANLVKERIDGFRGTWLWGEDSPAEGIIIQGCFYQSEREDFDSEANLYRVSRDYFLWQSER